MILNCQLSPGCVEYFPVVLLITNSPSGLSFCTRMTSHVTYLKRIEQFVYYHWWFNFKKKIQVKSTYLGYISHIYLPNDNLAGRSVILPAQFIPHSRLVCLHSQQFQVHHWEHNLQSNSSHFTQTIVH